VVATVERRVHMMITNNRFREAIGDHRWLDWRETLRGPQVVRLARAKVGIWEASSDPITYPDRHKIHECINHFAVSSQAAVSLSYLAIQI
jgi:hypothetical protein